ncbi:MAG: NADH-quinone oxidoreductase subunit A [Bradymonadales bacterium]|nr:NADH-quinone oxidoreductase subunit A [Bradymonadales bacterium]
MAVDFATVLIFLAVASAFVAVALLLGRFLRPKVAEPDKGSIYECGERPIGTARFNFNPRFYVIALVFIIFEVEVALTFPVAVAFNHWLGGGRGTLAAVEIVLFLLVLVAGLAYVWAKGDLDWIREVRSDGEENR